MCVAQPRLSPPRPPPTSKPVRTNVVMLPIVINVPITNWGDKNPRRYWHLVSH